MRQRKASPELRKLARDFYNRFGITDNLSVEQFDIFIIDHKLAVDPETDEKGDARYIKFVQDRTHARNRINRGAKWLDDESFAICIEDAGVTYSVKPWTESSVNEAKEIGNRVETFARNRKAVLTRDMLTARQLLDEDPNNKELAEASAMLNLLDVEAAQLKAQVAGLVNRYALASDKVHEKMLQLQARYNDPQLPSPGTES